MTSPHLCPNPACRTDAGGRVTTRVIGVRRDERTGAAVRYRRCPKCGTRVQTVETVRPAAAGHPPKVRIAAADAG